VDTVNSGGKRPAPMVPAKPTGVHHHANDYDEGGDHDQQHQYPHDIGGINIWVFVA
jgi:hypothetical protein